MGEVFATSVPGVPDVPGEKQPPGNLFDLLAVWSPSPEVVVSDLEHLEHREQGPQSSWGQTICSAPDLPVATRINLEQPGAIGSFDPAARALLAELHAELDRVAR